MERRTLCLTSIQKPIADLAQFLYINPLITASSTNTNSQTIPPFIAVAPIVPQPSISPTKNSRYAMLFSMFLILTSGSGTLPEIDEGKSPPWASTQHIPLIGTMVWGARWAMEVSALPWKTLLASSVSGFRVATAENNYPRVGEASIDLDKVFLHGYVYELVHHGFYSIGPELYHGFHSIGPNKVVQHKEVSFLAIEYPNYIEAGFKKVVWAILWELLGVILGGSGCCSILACRFSCCIGLWAGGLVGLSWAVSYFAHF